MRFLPLAMIACGSPFHANAGQGPCSDSGTAGAPRLTASQSAVQVETPQGAFVGTLETPDGCPPYPLVLIYAGSGPTDQDGNDVAAGLDTDTYKDLAADLAASGIASVRYDKRCVGASVCGIANEAAFTFDDDVADGLLWAQKFMHDARFEGLTLAGHSEGSLWAILVAEQVPAAAIISLEGAGRPIGQVLREQLGKLFANDSLLRMQANEIIASLETGMAVTNVPPGLANLFGPMVQPYLMSWMKYDPAKEIAKLGQPILVAQGTNDSQVDVQDANLLVAANPQAQLLLVEGMSHVLKDAPPPPASQDQAYKDPSLPIDAKLASGVVSFVRKLP
jgi:pimeloyl-ACP methyl ester carboxylesterase